MSRAFDPTNRSALEFNISHVEKVSTICQPLFNNFGINTFVYSHFFNNGTYLDLCTNIAWQQHYIEHFAAHSFIIEYVRTIYQNSTHYVLWNNDSTLPREQIFKKFIIDSCGFDIWHGFSIYKNHKDSLEAWHFATTKDNFKIINFYLNHLDLLNRFISYFQNKAASLLNIADPKKLIVLHKFEYIIDKLDEISSNEVIDNYINQTKIKHYSINTSRGMINISNREAECIAYLSMSRTVKEIALLMKLSPRTVESYLESAKRKLGCWTRSQLVESFLNYQGGSLEHVLRMPKFVRSQT